jgi:hypothetical protein
VPLLGRDKCRWFENIRKFEKQAKEMKTDCIPSNEVIPE